MRAARNGIRGNRMEFARRRHVFSVLALVASAFPMLSEPACAAPAALCPCSLWPDNPIPQTRAANDSNAVEVGVKFTSDADGLITALRFYPGDGNSGPHIGHLWTLDDRRNL